MRSDFWSLLYAAQQAIRRGESAARSARARAYTISELEAAFEQSQKRERELVEALGIARDALRSIANHDGVSYRFGDEVRSISNVALGRTALKSIDRVSNDQGGSNE